MGNRDPAAGDVGRSPGERGADHVAWRARAAAARVVLGCAARHPACWLGAALGGSAPVVLSHLPAPWVCGAGVAVGGLAAGAAIGAAAGSGWIAGRALWPGAGVLIGAAAAGSASAGCAVLTGVTLATVVFACLRRDAWAADAVSTALVASAGTGALAGAVATWTADPWQGALAGALVAAAVCLAIRSGARRQIEWLSEPVPWVPRRVASPLPGATRLRGALVSAAMVSGLATMVGGLFLMPSAVVAMRGGGAWLVALAAPPACLGPVAGADVALGRAAASSIRAVGWHAAIIGWPMCVAIALSAGDPLRLRAACLALVAVAGLAIMIAAAAVWARWGKRGEGAHAAALVASAVALLAIGVISTR